MATNPNIALSYQPNVALQRRDPLADAANIQALQANQTKMDDLREFKEFSTRLAAAGKDPDPLALAREMKASGRPEMVMKALELETQIKALGLEDQAYKALIGGGAAAAAPAMPQAAPAAAPGSFAADVATRRAAMPANTLAPTPVASTNAMVPTPAAPTNATDPRVQEINRLMGIATQFPTTKAGMQAMKSAELMQQVNKPYVVGGRLVTGAGTELYAAPDKPTDLQRNYEFAKTPAGGNFKGSLAEFKVLATPRTTVNVPVNVSTEKKYGERFGGLIADADAAKLAAAEAAPQAAATADRIMDLIDSGKVITGTGANARLQIAKALNLAGNTDAEKIRNTEILGASLAETTLGAIKSSNLGAGQGFTNADRDFLEKAKAGQITFDAQSLKELARLARLAAEKSAESWNKRVTQIPSSALEGTGISTQPVVVPPRSIMKNSGRKGAASTNAPAGVDPNIWQYMTPEERNLWPK